MDNDKLQSLISEYKLSQDEHNEVLGSLKEKIFKGVKEADKPSIVFVIGQPGSGKSTFIDNSNFSNYVIINSDKYRQYNKYSEEIVAKYPTYYTKLTNFDAHLWGDELFSYGISEGYSVLREKAPIDYSLLEVIKDLSSKYEVIIDVLVVGNLESLLRTRERYEQEISINKNARLSNIDSHNKCYDLLPDFVNKCLSYGAIVNYILPINDGYDIISANKNNLELLDNLRKEINKKACSNYKDRVDNLKKVMDARNALQEQFDELQKIEDIYLGLISS